MAYLVEYLGLSAALVGCGGSPELGGNVRRILQGLAGRELVE